MDSGARRHGGNLKCKQPMTDNTQPRTGNQGPRTELRDLILALRPSQWTKNIVVLAAFLFAYWDRLRAQPLTLFDLLVATAGMLLFCIVSSGIYVLNDIRDIDADRRHPLKRLRPVAAARIPVRQAWTISISLLCAGLVASYVLSRPFGLVVSCYVLIQLVYSYWLKQVALIDILVIAAGFVLRAVAGAVVLNEVTISPWLLLCAFLLAIFLALCKRRHEKILLDDTVNQHRPSLEKYDKRLLDQLIGISASATIVSYAVYTLWPQTVKKFGTAGLGITIPFVIFGIFRYLDLVYRHEKGDRPEKILLTDLPLLVDLALYGMTVLAVFLFHP